MKRFTFFAFFLIIFIALFSFHSAYEKVKADQIDALKHIQRSNALLAKAGIESFMRHCITMLEHLARHREIVDFNQEGKKLLQDFYHAHKNEIKAVSRIDAQGQFKYIFPGVVPYDGANVSHREFFQRMRKTMRPVVSQIITSLEGYERIIAFHAPVIKRGMYDGSVALIISIDDLADRFLKRIEISETGYCWMLSREGMELYCPVPEHIGKTVYETSSKYPSVRVMAEKMMRGEEGTTTYEYDHIRGEETKTTRRHAVYMPIYVGDTFWSIAVATPEGEVFAHMAGFRNRLFVIITMLLLGISLFSYEMIRTRMSLREEIKRKEIENALRESWQRMTEIFNFLPDATFVIDRQGVVISWNKAIEEMTGVTAAEMVGKGDYEYALPFYGERRPILIDLILHSDEDIKQKYRDVRRQGNSLIGIAEIPNLKGRKVWLWGIACPLYDSHGDIVGAIESIRDITDQKELEDLYMTLANRSQVGVYIVQNGRIVFTNPHIPQYSGYSMDELIGSKIINYVFPQDRELVRENARKMLQGELSVPYEYRIIDKNGEIKWLMEIVTPVQYHGKTAVLGNTMDITDYKRAGENLIKSEQKYRALVENANSIILWWDNQGTILFMNPYGLDFFGYREEELIGKNVMGTIVPETESLTNRNLAALIAEIQRDPDRFKNNENENIRKDGSRVWISWTNRAIQDNQGNVTEILSIGNDITERKKLEAALIRAQKMESLGTFAGGIAHDFNNILGAIIGYTEILNHRLPDGTPEKRYTSNILRGCERAADIVKQILYFSRTQERHMRPVSLGLVVKETLKLIRASLPSTIQIVQRTEGNDNIVADPTQIHQVIMNLCSNAGHAMRDKGGVLEVEVREYVVWPDSRVKTIGLTPGSYVKLTVRDTGYGIEKAHLNKIFDPFFTTKKPGEGTGLGLAVVHGIVTDHGGIVDVESEVGKGTSFYIYFPALDEKPHRFETEKEKPLPRGNEVILFVDDEEALVEIVRTELEHLGYTVITKTKSSEALEVFSREPEKFDLVITDLTMPHMTGIELANKIWELRQLTPIILCTGFNDIITRKQALEMGFRELLHKPWVIKDFALSIRHILDGLDVP